MYYHSVTHSGNCADKTSGHSIKTILGYSRIEITLEFLCHQYLTMLFDRTLPKNAFNEGDTNYCKILCVENIIFFLYLNVKF